MLTDILQLHWRSIVSSDVVGMSFGSLFDATQTKVQTVDGHQLVKTVSCVEQWNLIHFTTCTYSWILHKKLLNNSVVY